MNSQSKGLSMLGLAMKAGKVSSGEFATEQHTLSFWRKRRRPIHRRNFAICVHTIKCHAFFLGTKSSLEEPSEENTVLPLPYVKRILQKK